MVIKDLFYFLTIMRNLAIAGFILLSPLFSESQTDLTSRVMIPVEIPSAIERYNVDYRLKDYQFQNGDSTVLLQLDLEYLDGLRIEDSDIEKVDPNTGLTVVLFNRKRNPKKEGTINPNAEEL